MKEASRKKKRRFFKPAAAGFAALYLLIMSLATLLVKERFTDEYIRTLEEVAASIQKRAYDQESGITGEGAAKEEPGTRTWNAAERKEFYQKLVNEYFFSTTNPDLMISVAAYDENKELLAKSCDMIGDMMYTAASSSDVTYGPYALDDYLTFEEKEQLAEYYFQNMQSTEDYTLPEKYRISIGTSADGQKLYGIYVQELTWREDEKGDEEGEEKAQDQYVDPLTGSIAISTTGTSIDYETGMEVGEEKVFREVGSEVVWEWANPDIGDGQRRNGKIQGTTVGFPYMNSYENWHRWSSSEFLHGFLAQYVPWEEGEEGPAPGLYPVRSRLYLGVRYELKIGPIDGPFAYLDVRMEESPWLAAFDYMKYLYLIGLMLTFVCMFLVIIEFGRAYDRQTALEEMRRDFTNVMAHELKTPLGIIRNFAENLAERNMEEKRDYYLTQIIGQTEEMDSLVAEMIEISKLDSEELVLRKEPVSVGELVREQMDRLKPLIDERNLRVEYQEEAEFLTDGDREYLAKAVWNLLSNAIEYNVPDGWIRVRTEAGQCSIENAGEPMEEDQLLHAFDLSYTGNKSRDRKKKHMRIGLFLAKKILALHGMDLTIGNTDEGICVVVRR